MEEVGEYLIRFVNYLKNNNLYINTLSFYNQLLEFITLTILNALKIPQVYKIYGYQ